MLRRPPRSTLFPYTTALPISEGARSRRARAAGDVPRRIPRRAQARAPHAQAHADRSEEHTSELQSLRHLVCRLLLEKKKDSHVKRMLTGLTSMHVSYVSSQRP